MKVIPIGIATHYAKKSQSTAIMVLITRRDSVVFGCTSHDVEIIYQGITFESGLPSIEQSQMLHSSSFASDNSELSGLLSNNGLSQVDIESGDWDGAAVQVWRLNWNSLADGHEVLGIGELGQFSHDGIKYRVEYKGMTDRLQKIITRAYLPACDATFGDSRCKLDAATFTFAATVTSVTDRRNFIATALTQTSDYFTFGKVTWTSGLNDGRAMEIKDHFTGGGIELALAMPYPIQVGDGLDALVGDDHLLTTCRDKFNNIVNYRGFWYIPGVDQMLRGGGQ